LHFFRTMIQNVHNKYERGVNMKAIKRVLSLVMAVLLLVSCLSISAFADTAQVKQYGSNGGKVLVIGDSFGSGMGAGDNWYDLIYNYNNP